MRKVSGLQNPTENHQQRLQFVCALARQVGQEALRYWEEQGSKGLGTSSKGLQDFVTEADKQAENTIRTAVLETYSEDGFIGEEGGGTPGTAGYWVVDPIDGTSNYLRGLRHWGVSIAYVENGETVVGVIHDSPTDRTYAASLGGGATRDGLPISVSDTTDPLISYGILGASRRTSFDIYLDQLRALHDAGIEHRRIGSAAIGIVRVAEGVADFYYEKHLNCWDAMAALLIAKEAGARITVPAPDEFIARGGEVLCATPGLNQHFEKILLNR